MNAIVRRLRKLEHEARTGVNEQGQTLAEQVRERRKRRLEAAGLPFEVRQEERVTGVRSYGEALRLELRRARERKR